MSTNRTGALTIFHAFPRLPAELRSMIWEESLQASPPRVVEITFSFPTKKWHPRAPPPAPLHVSQEARQLALTRYQAVPLPRDGARPAMAFVDFSRDVVFLRSQSDPAPGHLGRIYDHVILDLESIRARCLHLALPAPLVTGLPLVRLLARFDQLEVLTIVAPTHDTPSPSSPDAERLSLVPDLRPRKERSRTLAAAGIISFSTVVRVVLHAQAVRGEVSDITP